MAALALPASMTSRMPSISSQPYLQAWASTIYFVIGERMVKNGIDRRCPGRFWRFSRLFSHHYHCDTIHLCPRRPKHGAHFTRNGLGTYAYMPWLCMAIGIFSKRYLRLSHHGHKILRAPSNRSGVYRHQMDHSRFPIAADSFLRDL